MSNAEKKCAIHARGGVPLRPHAYYGVIHRVAHGRATRTVCGEALRSIAEDARGVSAHIPGYTTIASIVTCRRCKEGAT